MSRNSHKEFLTRLDQSRKSTFLVAEYLHRSGYNAEIPAFDYRDQHTNWLDHVDDGDLFIQKSNGPRHRIDVKHVSFRFTSQKDVRVQNLFVADVRAIERANPFPLAYISVNNQCTHMAIIWAKTKPLWDVHEVFASNTGKMITVMRCPVDQIDFRSFND